MPATTQPRSWSEILLSYIRPPVTPRYRLTMQGLLFILLMATVGFAAWHSGTNLLYLLLSAMIGLFLLHGVTATMILRGLECRVSLPREAMAGKPVSFVIAVRNRKRWLPAYGILLQTHTSDGLLAGTGYLDEAPKEAATEVECPVVFQQRGRYRFGTLDLRTWFPFGFAQRGFTQRFADEIVVTPPVLDASALFNQFGALSGDETSRERGVGIEPYGLREYVEGEHVRRIHWRSSAKAGRPMVLEYVREGSRRVCLGFHGSETTSPTAQAEYEGAVVMMASIAAALLEQGWEVGIAHESAPLEFGSGGKHRLAILRHLATVQPTSATPRTPRGAAQDMILIGYGEGQPPPTSAQIQWVHVRDWTATDGTFRPRGGAQ